MNTKPPQTISLRIRLTTAKSVIKAVELLYSVDALDYSEVQAIRMALNGLAKHGELPTEPEKRLLDLHAVAEKLSLGESTLKRLLADGSINLPKVRLGGAVRFRLADVERLVDGIEDDRKEDEASLLSDK